MSPKQFSIIVSVIAHSVGCLSEAILSISPNRSRSDCAESATASRNMLNDLKSIASEAAE